ncbi:MAG: HU family DNA-binding protein [Candidatus Planktophila sp.]|jgi:DNA-binding protein HU-beta|nr:HU family DNA-binding protein [Candidatus Planktophila sp.]MBP7903147.1 HU family DNA-binding protein [Candidatus Planktophila sp.]
MNKAQFIAALAPHFNGSKKEAAHAVDIVFDTIVRNMSAGNDVMINDFGKFKKVDRKARMGRNPFTGETIKIKASKKARFLPAKALKEIIAGDRKLGPAPKPEVKPVAKVVAKPAAKKAVAKKPAAKKAVAKKPAAKKAVAKKAPAKKKPVAKKVVKKAVKKK